MNEMPGNEHPTDDLAAYALDALEPGEADGVRDHLESCERCRAELRWLEPAVDVLPASVPQVDPPPDAQARPDEEVRADVRAERGGWWSRHSGWITLRARPAVMVAGVALLIAGVGGYAINAANPDSGPVTTVAQDTSAVLDRTQEGAVLRVSGMPELQGEDVYQLWFRDGPSVEPAAAFTVGEGGDGEADIGQIPAGTDELVITEESEPGLDAPQGDEVMSTPV